MRLSNHTAVQLSNTFNACVQNFLHVPAWLLRRWMSAWNVPTLRSGTTSAGRHHAPAAFFNSESQPGWGHDCKLTGHKTRVMTSGVSWVRPIFWMVSRVRGAPAGALSCWKLKKSQQSFNTVDDVKFCWDLGQKFAVTKNSVLTVVLK